MSARVGGVGRIVPSRRYGVTSIRPGRFLGRRASLTTRLRFDKGVGEKVDEKGSSGGKEGLGEQLMLKVSAGDPNPQATHRRLIPLTTWKTRSTDGEPTPATLDAPPSLPVESLAQMVSSITEREDGGCYMTVKRPGALAFPNILEHHDGVYALRIERETDIQLEWLVTYVLRRGELESEIQIGRVIAGPGCQVEIQDGQVKVMRRGTGVVEVYDINDRQMETRFTIDSESDQFFIITERDSGRRFFLNELESPLLVSRNHMQYRLRYVEGERIKTGADVEELGIALQQSVRQGDWKKKLVIYKGDRNAQYVIVAVGPSRSPGDDGVNLTRGDLLIRRVGSHRIKKVHVSDIEARVIPYERQL